MNREKVQTVYRCVDPVSPTRAAELGIITDKPILLEGHSKRFKVDEANGIEVYQPGGVIPTGNKLGLTVFTELETVKLYESIGAWGYVPFTGFIAVCEITGEALSSSFSVMENGMRVKGFKAFSNEQEVKQGFLREFFNPYNLGSQLIIDKDGRIAPGKERYAF